MDILQKTGLSHKFSEELAEWLRICAFHDGLDFDDVDWVIQEMKNRIVIGNCRYERLPDVDPDQDAVLPKGWRNGFDFFSTPLDVWRSGVRNKWRVLNSAVNGDFVPDVCNYCMFLYMTTDCALEAETARQTAYCALVFLSMGRAGLIDGYHETSLDQGIHGQEASGSANIKRKSNRV